MALLGSVHCCARVHPVCARACPLAGPGCGGSPTARRAASRQPIRSARSTPNERYRPRYRMGSGIVSALAPARGGLPLRGLRDVMPATSAPGFGSPAAHIRTGTGLTRWHICPRTGLCAATSAPGPGQRTRTGRACGLSAAGAIGTATTPPPPPSAMQARHRGRPQRRRRCTLHTRGAPNVASHVCVAPLGSLAPPSQPCHTPAAGLRTPTVVVL